MKISRFHSAKLLITLSLLAPSSGSAFGQVKWMTNFASEWSPSFSEACFVHCRCHMKKFFLSSAFELRAAAGRVLVPGRGRDGDVSTPYNDKFGVS